MKKRIIKGLILLVAAGLLVASTIMGTLAYLTSSSTVSNTFTVGNVGIQMFEHPVDANGKILSGSTLSSDGNSYHLQPGGEYDKDPTIIVDSASDESYLFVKIRNDLRNVEANNGVTMHNGSSTYLSLSEQVAANGWYFIGRTSNANVYVYKDFVGKNNTDCDIEIFNNFKIDTNADLSTHGASIVTLFGFAIQTTGFKPADDSTGIETTIVDGKAVPTAEALAAARNAWGAIGSVYTMQDTHLTNTTTPFKKGDNNYGTTTGGSNT